MNVDYITKLLVILLKKNRVEKKKIFKKKLEITNMK